MHQIELFKLHCIRNVTGLSLDILRALLQTFVMLNTGSEATQIGAFRNLSFTAIIDLQYNMPGSSFPSTIKSYLTNHIIAKQLV